MHQLDVPVKASLTGNNGQTSLTMTIPLGISLMVPMTQIFNLSISTSKPDNITKLLEATKDGSVL